MAQVCFAARQYWVTQDNFRAFRDRCCCPTILLAAAGPFMMILGAVFTDRPIIRPLTDMLSMGQSSTHPGARSAS
ncbi:hypothetical protein APHAL10511_003460 [Amanita phalloides]|nr:hypothetical protein APHAL10511_003460 [Amanita phalloides]